MGFRKGTYAKVWEVKPVFDTNTKCRISISKKNKDGEYETDFSGYVSFVGTVAAKKAATLKEGDSIQLGDVDVSTKYDSDKNVTYYNFKCFSFDLADSKPANNNTDAEPQPAVDDGEVDDDRLPF